MEKMGEGVKEKDVYFLKHPDKRRRGKLKKEHEEKAE
jgi:hypothetical protein